MTNFPYEEILTLSNTTTYCLSLEVILLSWLMYTRNNMHVSSIQLPAQILKI